jgi:hypothetical protein
MFFIPDWEEGKKMPFSNQPQVKLSHQAMASTKA